MKQAVGNALITTGVAIFSYLFYKICAGLCDEIAKQSENCKCLCHDWEKPAFKCHLCKCERNEP